jgi:hypothetical protein
LIGELHMAEEAKWRVRQQWLHPMTLVLQPLLAPARA